MTRANYSAIMKIAMSLLVAVGLMSCSTAVTDNVAVITTSHAGQAETDAMVELLAANGSAVTVLPLAELVNLQDVYRQPFSSCIRACC